MSLRLGAYPIALLSCLSLTVLPVSRLAARQASFAMAEAREKAIEGGKSEIDANLIADDVYSRSLARTAIIAWEGDIADSDGNVPAVTSENIDLLMAQAEPLEAFVEKYVNPYIAGMLEKNGLAPSSTGNTPTTAAPTADDALSAQASSTATVKGPPEDDPPKNAPS